MDAGEYTFYNKTARRYLSHRGRTLILSSAPMLWTLKPATGRGYHFYAHNTELLLDIDNAYVAAGSTVKIWDYTGYDVQIWTLAPNANGTYSILYSGNSKYCLGFDGEKAILQIRNPNNFLQEWTMVKVRETPKEYRSFVSKSGTVALQLPLDITHVISEPQLRRWVDKLETAYNSFCQLTGFQPFPRIVVEAYKPGKYPGFAGWVFPNSNIIHIDRDFLYRDLRKMNVRRNDWNFCALHEMGHMFDFDRPWNFEAELLTDLKVAYVMEKNGAAAAPAEFDAFTIFHGSDIARAYEVLGKDFSETYNVFGCTKRFLDIKEKIGWEPFRKTFHHLQKYNASYTGLSKQERLELFVNVLSHYSNQNIKAYFSPGEWNAIVRKVRS